MKGAFYEKEITPPLGSDMPGYYCHRYAESVMDRLYVKAFVSEAGGDYAAIIVIDACYLTRDICEAIAQRVQDLTGIPSRHVAVCATHTHNGIPVEKTGENDADLAFLEILIKLSADCAVLASQRLEVCTFWYGAEQVEDVAYNRIYEMKDGSFRTNPIGEKDKALRQYSGVDSELPALLVKNAQGEPMGTIWSFACHHDTVARSLSISSDYSGIASSELKRVYGEDFISMYVAGASGDINNWPPELTEVQREQHRVIGKKLADALTGIFKKAVRSERDSIRCCKDDLILGVRRASAEEIKRAKAMTEDTEYSNKFGTPGEATMSEALLEYEALDLKNRSVPLQVIFLGDVGFFTFPGEMFHQFGEMVKKANPSKKTLVATVANDNIGYVPVRELFGTDIYEAQLCMGSFLEPDAGYLMARRENEIAHALWLQKCK